MAAGGAEQHDAYEEYTWEQAVQAVYGVKPTWSKDGNGNWYQHVWSGWDYTKIYPNGMQALSFGFLQVHDQLKGASQNLGLNVRYLTGAKEAPGTGGKWTGPAATQFNRIGNTLIKYVEDTQLVMDDPSWTNLTLEVWNAHHQARRGLDQAWLDSWVWHPPSSKVVEVPSTGGRGGPPQKKYKTVETPGFYAWNTNVAAENAQWAIIKLVGEYQRIGNSYKTLPLPPDFGEKPSAIADKEELEAEQKQEKEDLKKEKEEAKKEQEKAEKKFDDAQKKADKDAKAQQDKFDKQFKDQQDAQDAASKANTDALKDLNKQPPGGGQLPGDVPGAPPGALLDPPKDLASAPGADPFAPPGSEPGFEPPPAGAVPTFFGGTPVPGGIDLDGDGKPELDEQGQLLPGVDPSTLPVPPRPTLPEGDGPPGFPPGTLFLPPPPPTDDLAPGPGAAPGRTGKPFVRSPDLDLAPFKPGNLRTTTGGPDDAAEFGPGRALRAAGPGGPPNAAGASGGGRAFVGGVPGLPGLGAGMPMGGMGYPPPMMGGMGPAGAGGQQTQERERQTWLLEDDEIWSEGDEMSSVLGRPGDDDEDEEF